MDPVWRFRIDGSQAEGAHGFFGEDLGAELASAMSVGCISVIFFLHTATDRPCPRRGVDGRWRGALVFG